MTAPGRRGVAGARRRRVAGRVKAGVAVAAALGASAVVGLFLALPQPGETVPPPASGFAIREVRVFDGERTIPRANVVVRDGRIVTIGPEVAIPEGLPVTDGAGRTLLPGLIDAHVHAYDDGALLDALNFGVTTALDQMGDPAKLRELKAARDSYGAIGHADLYGSGWAATVPKGHGTQFGLPVPTLTTPAEAEAFVAARFREGSDWLKIMYEPQDPAGLGPRIPSIDPPTLRALVSAAHARGKLAVAHVSRYWPARDALEGGIDGLVHVYADMHADAGFLALARERRVFVVPTLTVTLHFAGALDPHALAADPRIAPYLNPAQRRHLAAPRPEGYRLRFMRPDVPLVATGALHAAGLDVLAGSDAPNPGTVHGASLHQELELLVAAGMPPIAALAGATSRPAARFGLVDRGRIAPGKRADLLLVEGDPTIDVTATRAIVAVWKNGAAFERRRYAEAP